MEIRLTIDLDGELLERWALTDWDLNKPVGRQVLMDEIRQEWEKAQQRIIASKA